MQAQFKQALSYHQSGQFNQAEFLYRELLKQDPKNPLLNAQLGMLLHQTRRSTEALPFIIVAIDLCPNEVNLALQGIEIAIQLAKNNLADTWLKQVIAIKPDDVKLCEKLAGVLVGNHKEKEALELIKKIIRLDPKSVNAYNLKGLALSRLGETDKGYKCFQKAVKLNPGQLGVIRNLILYGKQKKEPILDSLIPQLEKNLVQQSLPPQVQMNMAYVISMFYEQRKITGKAFHFLKQGNDINRASYPYQHQDTQLQFDAIKSTFNNELKQLFELSADEQKGLSDSSPIFILGMPRSGTTLVEQILSSHSLVEAEGEIIDLKQAFETRPDIMNHDLYGDSLVSACLEVATLYLKNVRSRQTAQYFTDKMPYNFMLIGLIALALPNAKIIHCTRDPLETCFSIYKQNFSGNHSYTNDLTELGFYYKSYECLMTHWKSLFCDQIYEANYEKMVDDSEQEIANLLGFCGLETEAECFEFHKNKRAVRTASVAQVRQPIYKDAKRASKPYEKQLAPLIKVLNN